MKMPPAGRGVLLALLVSLAPAQAHAQISPPPPQDDESRPRIRFGGISINPTIALTNVGVDSNVFNSLDDPKQDFTSTLSPGLDMWIRGGKIRMALRGRGDLVYFQKYRSERSIDGGFGERLEIALNRVIPWYEGGVYSGRQRLGYEVDARSRLTQNTLGGGINLRVGPKTTIGVGVRRGTVAWDADARFLGTNISSYLNRTTDSALVSYTQALTALTTFVAEGIVSRERFAVTTARDTDSVRGMIGLDLKTRALISGSARVGYRDLDAVGGGFPRFQGVVAAVNVGYSLRGVTRLNVRTNRDASFSFEPLYPYFVQTGVGATVTQKVTGRWDAQVMAERQQLAYRILTGVQETVLPNRTDRVDIRGGGIGYHMNPDVRIGFTVDKFRRTSPVQRRAFEGYRAWASVSYAR